jgi:hypothetical protein
MTVRLSSRGRRAIMVGVCALGLALSSAATAEAHTPIILDRSDVLPWTSPLILDGTNPVALYGTLPHCLSVRSAQFDMHAGQPLRLGYGIPDEAPENQLSTSNLPDLVLLAPDGSAKVLTPVTSQPVETEDGLKLLLVNMYGTAAEEGTYSVLVVGGCTPERFVVSIGTDPGGFAGVLRGSVATDAQVMQWYDTPPARDRAGR